MLKYGSKWLLPQKKGTTLDHKPDYLSLPDKHLRPLENAAPYLFSAHRLPILPDIELPEGADEFIGVRAEILVEGQSQTWSPDADAEDTDPVSKPIVEYLYLERCRGKVEVNGK